MFRKRGRELVFDLVVAIGWIIYTTIFLSRLLTRGKAIDLGLLLFFTLLAVMFLIRSPAQRLGAPWETLLALVGTFLSAVMPRPASGGLPWLEEGIQITSLAVMAAALISLGRSFAIAPAAGVCGPQVSVVGCDIGCTPRRFSSISGAWW